jgi:hypothetical protein
MERRRPSPPLSTIVDGSYWTSLNTIRFADAALSTADRQLSSATTSVRRVLPTLSGPVMVHPVERPPILAGQQADHLRQAVVQPRPSAKGVRSSTTRHSQHETSWKPRPRQNGAARLGISQWAVQESYPASQAQAVVWSRSAAPVPVLRHSGTGVGDMQIDTARRRL